MSETCVCCGREIPEGRMVCLTCESISLGGPDAFLHDGTPVYFKYRDPIASEKNPGGELSQLWFYNMLSSKPFEYPKPMNPFRGNTPYQSKYFIDRRFDPPRPITADDIYRAMKELKEKKI